MIQMTFNDGTHLNAISSTKTNLMHTKTWRQICDLSGFVSGKIKNDVFLAGGAIRSFFTEQPVQDFDLYCRNAQAHYEVSNLLSRYSSCTHQTGNAKTYEVQLKDETCKVQLIEAYFGDIPTVLNKFDFTVCQGAYNFEREQFWIADRFLLDNVQRKLVYNFNNEYPLSALARTQKYAEYGYKISNHELMKIAMKIGTLNLNDSTEFLKQIGGVSVRASDVFSGCIDLQGYLKQLDRMNSNVLKMIEE